QDSPPPPSPPTHRLTPLPSWPKVSAKEAPNSLLLSIHLQLPLPSRNHPPLTPPGIFQKLQRPAPPSSHPTESAQLGKERACRFVHRAQLNCIPLNGAVRHGNQEKRCRKCSYLNEPLPHVLCGCQHHSGAWWHHHMTIENRQMKAISPSLGKIIVDSAIPERTANYNPTSS
ncbi:hypothetical protein KIL84_004209, partial [Mauremys mutica]